MRVIKIDYCHCNECPYFGTRIGDKWVDAGKNYHDKDTKRVLSALCFCSKADKKHERILKNYSSENFSLTCGLKVKEIEEEEAEII